MLAQGISGYITNQYLIFGDLAFVFAINISYV